MFGFELDLIPSLFSEFCKDDYYGGSCWATGKWEFTSGGRVVWLGFFIGEDLSIK